MQKTKLFTAIAILFCMNLPIAAGAGQQPISQQESDAIDAYVKSKTQGMVVTATYTSADNEKMSCVDITTLPDYQPVDEAAVAQEMLTRYHIVVSTDPAAATGPWITKSPCPVGSIGLMLLTRETILQAGSLENYLRLSQGNDAPPVPTPMPPPVPPIVANPLDTFDPATQTLHLNNVLVNGSVLHDITATLKQFQVVDIASSVAGDGVATRVTNPVDSFDPATNILRLNAVVVDNVQYNQVVLKLMDYQLRQ